MSEIEIPNWQLPDYEPDGSDNSLSIEGRYELQMGNDSWVQFSDRRQFIEKFALGLWKVAEWCEAQGNKGYSTNRLKGAGLPTEFLSDKKDSRLEGIIFFNADENVVCRKNPHWKDVWVKNYKNVRDWYTGIHAKIAEHEAEQAQAAAEAAKPKREHQPTVMAWDDLSTVEVAYLAACLDILERRNTRLSPRLPNPTNPKRKNRITCTNFWGKLFQREYWKFHMELMYRRDAEPPPQSSKKKDKAIKEDWAKASELLAKGADYFFSREFFRQAVEQVEEPDLRVDLDNLPKQPLEQTPISKLSDVELVQAFFKFVDQDYQPGSWDYEDMQLLLKELRIKMAAVKGQRV